MSKHTLSMTYIFHICTFSLVWTNGQTYIQKSMESSIKNRSKVHFIQKKIGSLLSSHFQICLNIH